MQTDYHSFPPTVLSKAISWFKWLGSLLSKQDFSIETNMLAFCLANSLQIIVFQAKNCGKSNHISLVESLLMLLQRDSSKSSEQGVGQITMHSKIFGG